MSKMVRYVYAVSAKTQHTEYHKQLRRRATHTRYTAAAATVISNGTTKLTKCRELCSLVININKLVKNYTTVAGNCKFSTTVSVRHKSSD